MKKDEVQDHVEKALDIALLVMQNGGSTFMAERTFRNVLAGFKHDTVWLTWRLDFVVAQVSGKDAPASILRPVGIIGVNLVRTSEAVILGERIKKGDIHIEAVEGEINRIKSIAPPYKFQVLLVAAPFAAAFYSQNLHGDTGSFVIAFIAACTGQLLRSKLQKMKVPVAPVTLVCGLLSACIAAAGLHWHWSREIPATMVSSIIYLTPGLPLINGFIDMVSHKHLFIGLERIFNATFLFLLLAVSIALSFTVFPF